MNEMATGNFTEITDKLLRKGVRSLRSWAMKRAIPVGSVYNAVKGKRNGKEAKAIRAKLARFLNEPTPGTN
jgi:hypothetical protein